MSYAIVPSRGCYGSHDIVNPIAVRGDLTVALQLAARATRSYRRMMTRYGGTTGGYRVVIVEVRRRDQISWLGHDLDRLPTTTATGRSS